MNKALHHSITCMFLIIVFFAGAYKLQSQNIGRFELPHYDQLPNRQIKRYSKTRKGLYGIVRKTVYAATMVTTFKSSAPTSRHRT